MTKGLFFIDIFIGKVHAACISDLAVNDDNFSVVSIVLNSVQNRDEAIKGDALNAFLFHSLYKVEWQAEKTTHVIIDDSHIQAECGFFL